MSDVVSRATWGRPKLPDEERRTAKLGLRWRPADLAAIEAAAAARSMDRGQFVRQAALKAAGGAAARTISRRAADEGQALLRRELRRVGVNLNQIAQLAHQGQLVPAELEGALADLRDVLATLIAKGTS